MQTIRTFIAIPLPPDIQRRVGTLVDRLRRLDEGHIKWVPNESLHLTLKFLGDVDNRAVPEICKVLRQECSDCDRFDLVFQGVGAFPDIYRARVVWVGVVAGGEHLTPLVQRLESSLAEIGYKREPRPYQAHLTIGRLKTGRRLNNEVAEMLAKQQENEFGAVSVSEVHLVASYLERRSASYTIMDRVALR
jgi:RNA 2',3'-cyclic 3'-phosphodiesterase